MGFYYPPTKIRIDQLAGITVGPTEPDGPQEGDLWVDLATGQLKVWHLGQWRTIGLDTPTDDRYAIAKTSLPGLQQTATGTLPVAGNITTSLPGVTQTAAGTID